ncbi:hypothetical protein F5883DRAFT_513947 [Diaporthe sp. PMI_573]|nr:hypothetical protein F5883DRAFT_513947 [Diaporthaceae sp. PMI_573]
MHLTLKTVLLGAAVSSAIPVVILPQWHHNNDTEFQHKALSHGRILPYVPPTPDTSGSPDLAAELDKCNISGYQTCTKRGGRDCEAELDRFGECRPDVRSLVRQLVPQDPNQLPEDEIKVSDGAIYINHDDAPASFNQAGQLGFGALVASQTPSCLLNCVRGPARGPEQNRARAECVRRCREEGQD